MPNLRSLFSFLLLTFLSAYATTEDNVVIENRAVKYNLKSNGAQLSSVKVEDVSQYVANRADANFYALSFYGNSITMDKAQAPGSRPVYRAWESSDLFHTGSRVCALSVSLKKGKPAKVVFERTYTKPEQFCQIILASPYQTNHAEFTIHVPGEIVGQLTFTPLNFPEGTTLSREDKPNGDAVYKVSLDNLKPLKLEPLSASAEVFAPQILVSGYFENTDRLYSFLKSKIDPDESSDTVADLAKQLCTHKKTDIERIDTIAAWVRNNIRYVAIEHDEFGLRPETAETVLKNRYGDCKGSANLIRQMLRAVGIDGRLVWIGTNGDVPCRWSENPSLACGNHQIAAAALPDTLIFIDGTTTFAPKGFIPATIAGQECLVLDGDNCRIETVPMYPDDTNMITLTGKLTVSDGSLSGTYEAVYEGAERVMLESTLAAVSTPKRGAVLQLIASYGRQGTVSDSISVSTEALDAKSTSISYHEKDASALRNVSGGKTYLQLKPLRAFDYPRLETNGRQAPIKLSRRKTFRTRLTCTIPAGLKVEKLPERARIDNKWVNGYVDYTLSDDGSTIECDALLRIINTEGSKDDIASWNESLKEIRNVSGNPVILAASTETELDN